MERVGDLTGGDDLSGDGLLEVRLEASARCRSQERFAFDTNFFQKMPDEIGLQLFERTELSATVADFFFDS